MNKKEIAELLALTKWSRRRLADELDLTENTIQRWFMLGDGEVVKGPASVLMRMWLEEARNNPSPPRPRKERQPA